MPCAVLALDSAKMPPGKSASRSGTLHPETRSLREHQATVREAEAGEGRVGDQQVPVEGDVVGRGAELRGLADPQLGLDHAAEHDLEVERPRRMDHPQRLADAAALGELD